MTDTDTNTPPADHSPAPWGYEYDPYTVQADGGGPSLELPAFEVFDDDGNRVFVTNENAPANEQEANAKLAVAAPVMQAALRAFVTAEELAEECHEWKWENLTEAFRLARAALAMVA